MDHNVDYEQLLPRPSGDELPTAPPRDPADSTTICYWAFIDGLAILNRRCLAARVRLVHLALIAMEMTRLIAVLDRKDDAHAYPEMVMMAFIRLRDRHVATLQGP